MWNHYLALISPRFLKGTHLQHHHTEDQVLTHEPQATRSCWSQLWQISKRSRHEEQLYKPTISEMETERHVLKLKGTSEQRHWGQRSVQWTLDVCLNGTFIVHVCIYALRLKKIKNNCYKSTKYLNSITRYVSRCDKHTDQMGMEVLRKYSTIYWLLNWHTLFW